MRRIQSLLAAALIGLSFGSTATTATAETVLTTASVNAVGSLANRLGNRFKELIAEAKSTLKVNHVEGTVLGNAPQVVDQLVSGAVDVVVNDVTWVAPFHADLKVINWSFAFRDTNHYDAFFRSDVFKAIVDQIAAEKGIRVLAAVSSQPRYFHSRVPIKSADDIKGKKVRVPQIKIFIDSWEAMGAVPTPLNYGEVFLAMKTGVIDAAFGNPSDTFPNNFHLSGPFVVRTGDTIGSYFIAVNEARYKSLSDNEKAVLLKAAQGAIEWAGQEAKKEMAGVVEEMKKTGATFSDIDLAPLRAATLARGKKLEAAGEWSKGLLEKIQAIK